VGEVYGRIFGSRVCACGYEAFMSQSRERENMINEDKGFAKGQLMLASTTCKGLKFALVLGPMIVADRNVKHDKAGSKIYMWARHRASPVAHTYASLAQSLSAQAIS
jgi:hypothetical protein